MKFLILLFPLFDGNFNDIILPHGLRLCKSFSVRMQKNIYILAAQSALCNFNRASGRLLRKKYIGMRLSQISFGSNKIAAIWVYRALIAKRFGRILESRHNF